MKKLFLFTLSLVFFNLNAQVVKVSGIHYSLDKSNKIAEVVKTAQSNYSGKIVIPNSIEYDGINYNVTSIGMHGFFGCSNLTSIIIGDNVTSIGYQAFSNCKLLSSIRMGEKIENIKEMAFTFCNSLTSVILPKTIKTIGSGAFYGCNTLNQIYCLSYSAPQTENDSFDNYYSKTLYVPESALNKYKESTLWSRFGNIRSLLDKYFLIYNIDNELFKKYEKDFNSAITPESYPTKEGFTFSGWSDIPEYMPNHDVTISGSFTINKYVLKYLIDGMVYKSMEYEYGATIIQEPIPDGDYESFEWLEQPTTMPAHDVVVSANYTKKSSESENLGHRMIINLKNGEKISFLLKEKPVISLEDNRIYVKTSSTSIDYLRSDFAEFYFEKVSSGVESIEYSGNDIVTIYDLEGHKITEEKSGNQSSIKMILDSYKPGIYIIKIGNQKTIKYYKK